MKSTTARKVVPSDDELDLVFTALADRTRRSLLARLAGESRTVSELAEPFAMSLPAVSKHLGVLERAGLVSRSVDGRVRRCTLHLGPLRSAEEWLSHYRGFWSDKLDALARHVEEPADAARPRRRRR
jgi:DNA-binding transcriptional ArsR family regulator